MTGLIWKRVSWRISNIDDDVSGLCLSEVLNNELAIFGQRDNDSICGLSH